MNEEERKMKTREILALAPDNSALMAAIAAHVNPTDATLYTMIKALIDALVLVPIVANGKEVGSGREDEKIYSVDEGDEVHVMELLDPNEQRVLPIFTSFETMRLQVPPDLGWGAMVRPVRQACAFALGAKFEGGVVLNPGSRTGVIALTGEILKAVAAGQLPPEL